MSSSASAQALELTVVLPLFLAHQKIDRNASPHTLAAYRRDLMHWMAYPETAPRLRDVSEAQLRAYVQSLHEAKQKTASIARKISAIRQFFKFCALEGLREDLPTQNLSAPKIEKKIPQFLSVEEMGNLLQAADDGLPYRSALAEALQARDRAMVFLLYATGLRVSELAGLELANLELSQSYLRVRGKGSKERVVPFATEALGRLNAYLTTFRAQLMHPKKPRCERVFLNHLGDGITRQTAWEVLKQLAAAAGLRSHLTPHLLRHSFATHMLQNGANLRSLQMLLGHSDLSTTQIYTHVTPEHLKTAHERYHRRGGK